MVYDNDKYQVIANVDTNVPIETELQEVRNLALARHYKSIDQQKISYSKHHDSEISWNSPVKKGKGCTCRVWIELLVDKEILD
jgi:hypothetical protein